MGIKWTAPKISSHKVRDENTPLVMLTAYDAPGAKMVTEAGADIILVGDTLGMVVLGYDDTLKVTIDDMGIEIIDVRVKRIDLPQEVSESVYE